MGLPLARACIDNHYVVKGSTTTPDKLKILEASSILPFCINCHPDIQGQHLQDFFNSQTLFLNIPFKRSLINPWFYKEQIASVVDYVRRSSVEWIIFASSTSVYPDSLKVAREDSIFEPDNERAQVLKDVEKMLLHDSGKKVTILRFAGLIGAKRQPGRFLSGQVKILDGHSPVNLVHQDDCIAIILKILDKGIHNIVLNVCADEHPSKKDFYQEAARRLGVPLPGFADGDMRGGKIVDNALVKKMLGYQFKYPDPLKAI